MESCHRKSPVWLNCEGNLQQGRGLVKGNLDTKAACLKPHLWDGDYCGDIRNSFRRSPRPFETAGLGSRFRYGAAGVIFATILGHLKPRGYGSRYWPRRVRGKSATAPMPRSWIRARTENFGCGCGCGGTMGRGQERGKKGAREGYRLRGRVMWRGQVMVPYSALLWRKKRGRHGYRPPLLLAVTFVVVRALYLPPAYSTPFPVCTIYRGQSAPPPTTPALLLCVAEW